MNWQEFLTFTREERQRVDFKMVYVDMTGDLISGLLLSQIVYWHSPDERGRIRLRVQHEGQYWLAKARHEWWDELRLSPKQVDRALSILEKAGIIEKRLFKFDGSPTVHVRIIPESFLAAWHKTVSGPRMNPYAPEPEADFPQKVKSELPEEEPPFSLKGKNDLPERLESLTENTTENTIKEDGANAPGAQAAPPHLPGPIATSKKKNGHTDTNDGDTLGKPGTAAAKEFWHQFRRKRWASFMQRDKWMETERTVGSDIMIRAVRWAAESGANNPVSVCTMALKLAKDSPARGSSPTKKRVIAFTDPDTGQRVQKEVVA
jgi:hypothetical protein